MEGQVTLEQWLAWKEDIREKLRETAGNFVHVGFRLKQIRDSGMLDGAADIFEFARNEYGLSKSSTSRFIAINERFSEGGNSTELRAEYKAIGSSKLAEMLTLTDAECRMITERTTVKEIRDLKDLSRQRAPAEGTVEGGGLAPLQKCLVEYFRDKKDTLNAVIRAWHEDAVKLAAETMNPSGYATYKKGLCYLFMYGYERGATARIVTEPEPRQMTWEELLAEVDLIFGSIHETGEGDVHGAYYGTPVRAEGSAPVPEPEAAIDPVATSQRQKDAEQQKRKSEKNKASERSKTAGIPSVESPGGSVATSQQGEPEEDAASDDLRAAWVQIEGLNEAMAKFVGYYNEDDAANRDIPLESLKRAYKYSISLVRCLEKLLMDAERAQNGRRMGAERAQKG